MFDRIFTEIFGDEVFNDLEKAFNEKFNEFKKESEKDNKDDFSYYHSVNDKFENGKNVQHDEKEIKNGKVLKDIHENARAVEDKQTVENTPQCGLDAKEYDKGHYAKENEKLRNELSNSEKRLNERANRIEELEKENADLRYNLNRIRNFVKSLSL